MGTTSGLHCARVPLFECHREMTMQHASQCTTERLPVMNYLHRSTLPLLERHGQLTLFGFGVQAPAGMLEDEGERGRRVVMLWHVDDVLRGPRSGSGRSGGDSREKVGTVHSTPSCLAVTVVLLPRLYGDVLPQPLEDRGTWVAGS